MSKKLVKDLYCTIYNDDNSNDDEESDLKSDMSDDYITELSDDGKRFFKEFYDSNQCDSEIEIDYDSEEWINYMSHKMNEYIVNGLFRPSYLIPSNNTDIETFKPYEYDYEYRAKDKIYYLVIRRCDNMKDVMKKAYDFIECANLRYMKYLKLGYKSHRSAREKVQTLSFNIKKNKKDEYEGHLLLNVNNLEEFLTSLNLINFKSSMYWIINKNQFEDLRKKIKKMKV